MSHEVPDPEVLANELEEWQAAHCAGNPDCPLPHTLFDGAIRLLKSRSVPAPRPEAQTRNRPSHNPGGMECATCGCIFVGEESHADCAICHTAKAEAKAAAVHSSPATVEVEGAVPRNAGVPFVDQRGTEDCERCCYAMMLGVSYESVPDFFTIFKQTRRDERQKWLRENFGLNYISVTAGAGSSPCILPDAFCIAGVASPTGHPDGHAVFGRIEGGAFRLIHDPNPQREKSGATPFDLTFFVPVNAAALSAAPPPRVATGCGTSGDPQILAALKRAKKMIGPHSLCADAMGYVMLDAAIATLERQLSDVGGTSGNESAGAAQEPALAEDRRDAERMRWLRANVTETITPESLKGEFAEHKTMFVLPKLIAWADFCGQISFDEAIDYAIASAAKGSKP